MMLLKYLSVPMVAKVAIYANCRLMSAKCYTAAH